MKKNNVSVEKIAVAGLMAALCYVGYAVFPAISASGTKVHIGNAFVVLGALLLGGVYGGLAGAVGLSLADILGGWPASAPRTFITKLVIGLIVGLVAHTLVKIDENKSYAKQVIWGFVAGAIALAFNCVFEPALKWLWYTLLTPDAEKASKAISALLAVTTYATIINAVINTVIGGVLYAAIKPALNKAGILQKLIPVSKKAA
ncbi:MAG: ECF transporter S component [Lachnospiraceae bacterium]|nr:ECF transporter S component [Lachnospiraceae bacterium]